MLFCLIILLILIFLNGNNTVRYDRSQLAYDLASGCRA